MLFESSCKRARGLRARLNIPNRKFFHSIAQAIRRQAGGESVCFKHDGNRLELARRASGALPGSGNGARTNVRRNRSFNANRLSAGCAQDCASVQDPLNRGGATINDQGDVTVVSRAATNATYAVSFVSGDGTQSTSIDNLKTDNHGNGALRKDAFFKFGTVGAGNVVLSSGGEPSPSPGCRSQRRSRVGARFSARPWYAVRM